LDHTLTLTGTVTMTIFNSKPEKLLFL